jgi:hypothetical protein
LLWERRDGIEIEEERLDDVGGSRAVTTQFSSTRKAKTYAEYDLTRVLFLLHEDQVYTPLGKYAEITTNLNHCHVLFQAWSLDSFKTCIFPAVQCSKPGYRGAAVFL